MNWIKQTGAGLLPGYVCSDCGVLWVTLEENAVPPEECRACGARSDTAREGDVG